ncbi:MAG: hypothetical protein ACTSYS_11075 [Promethearchaeota archaeon]
MNFIKNLSRKERIYYLVLLEFTIATLIIELVFMFPLILKFSGDALKTRIEFFVLTIVILSFFYLIPLYGKLKGNIKKVKFTITLIFLVKIVILIIMEAFDYFMGKNNFLTDYIYVTNYLNKLPNIVYYPPLNTIYFIIVFAVNPWKSTLLYRLINLSWEFGIYYMIYKISRIKKLGLNKNDLLNAIFIFTFSLESVNVVLLNGKFDTFVIFLSLIGIYLFFKEKWFSSGFVLVAVGFFKIYGFLWVLGIVFIFMKRKNWKMFKQFTTGSLLSGLLLTGISFILEGFEFFNRLLQLNWHFFDYYSIYNLNLTFYLYFTQIPFINILPYILILGFLMLYLLQLDSRMAELMLSLDFFITPVCILLIFFPSVNHHYIIWVLPLIALNFKKNIKRNRRATFFLYLNIALEVFMIFWMLIVNRYGEIMFNNLDYLPGTDILFIRFLTEITLTIGLLYYIQDMSVKTLRDFFNNIHLKKQENEIPIINKKNINEE